METFRGKRLIIPKSRNWEINDLTDKYSLKQRLSCRFEDNPIPLDVWKENPDLTLAQLQKKVKMCTLYPYEVGMQVLKIFKPKKWLDPTAGWGDRLRCAISYGCEYLGVDSNSGMQSAYKAIISDTGADPLKYRVKDGKFQNVRISGKYDLVFTSPPFYTVEKYDKMVGWESVEEFMEEFMIPLFKKSVRHLEQKGHIVLYIEDRPTAPFIQIMKEYVREAHPELQYEGAFYYEGFGKTPRPYYVWKLE
jgi:cyclopropane fatty-acyl-phospholipid synthase-like methyltransferase